MFPLPPHDPTSLTKEQRSQLQTASLISVIIILIVVIIGLYFVQKAYPPQTIQNSSMVDSINIIHQS